MKTPTIRLLLLLLGTPMLGNAQETQPLLEEQPDEISIEQECEQSADAQNLIGKARENHMADCLANWTNFAPQEDDSDQSPNTSP